MITFVYEKAEGNPDCCVCVTIADNVGMVHLSPMAIIDAAESLKSLFKTFHNEGAVEVVL